MKTYLIIPVLLISLVLTAHSQGTAFTYNGSLNSSGIRANGLYDFTFQIFDGPNAAANPVTIPFATNSVPVSNGLFTVTVDFGNGIFTGAPRWLQITVQSNSVPPAVTLNPRQQLTPSPYAIFAATSATVTNGAITSVQLAPASVGNAQIQSNAIHATQIASGQVVKNVNGLTDALTLSAGANITITPSGNTLQFSAPNTGGWGLAGNAGTSPGPNFIGTTDNQAFETHVNGIRGFRIEPTANNNANSNIVNILAGSPVNFISSGTHGATIAGGGAKNYFSQSSTNSVIGDFGTVGGGLGNTAAGTSTVAGGQNNNASGVYATIAGGQGNTAAGSDSFIGGGVNNFTKLSYSTVAGGAFNLCNNNFGVIGGGDGNYIFQDSEGSAILGGEFNTVWTNSRNSFIAGGASNSIINGSFSVVPGGLYNQIIDGSYSFAAGWGARALASGTFTWADPSTGASRYGTASNSFNVFSGNQIDLEAGTCSIAFSDALGIRLTRPTGGIAALADGSVYIQTQLNPSVTGVYIAAGGSGWNSLSDRNVKENFTDINARDVLEKVAQMPISIWNYKAQKKEVRHIGPMAQDFHTAFAVGDDDKHINNIDEEGVALAAIQGLNQKLESELKQKDTQIRDLEKSLADLKATVSQLMQRK